MPTNLRLLGVHGKNAPTKKSKSVQASDFNIAGFIGKFERKYAVAFPVNNPVEQRKIFGDHVNPNFFGNDILKTFWDNLAGSPATAYIKSHVGNNGTIIDAVIAQAFGTDQNGLASAIALAKDIQTKFNAHASDIVNHAVADSVNFPIVNPIVTLSELIGFVNAMTTAYSAHETDASLLSAWAFHVAQEGSAHSLASTNAVSNLAQAIVRLNDMKVKMNAHDADASAHNAPVSAHQITATNASATPVNSLLIQSAYQENMDYGVSGNRTGFKIEAGIRYTTNLYGSVASADTSAVVNSVIGIQVGDIMTINCTGGNGGAINKKITNIDESANRVYWSGALDPTNLITGADSDVVDVAGFKIRTYRKSLSGIETEVETSLGSIFCTMEPEVVGYYVQNVHKNNSWIKVTDQASGSTLLESFPDSTSVNQYLSGGADGTSPGTELNWSLDLASFNALPIRYLSNAETSNVAVQKAGESYCKSRSDTPFWIATIVKDQTLDQLKVIGSGYQRSDDVFQINVSDWIGISDPFNTSPNAPDRQIPNVGAVTGAWIRTITTLGIHYIPAVDQISLIGINSLINENLGVVGDETRTILAEYGINIIQFVAGSGYRIRNFFTPSTAQDFQFGNGILMRNFIKISAQDSLQSSENTPNSFNRIKQDADAVRAFLYRLWFKGSTNNVPEGETFGIQENSDGTLTTPEDHFEVVADAINNPISSINAGERNISVYFTFPTPAGSIEIDVGILLRS